MHEVRYFGQLVGRFETEEQAHDYRDARLSHPDEGPAFHEDELTVEPPRRFKLVVLGNLVDTFDTQTQAEAARDELLAAEPRTGMPSLQPDDVVVTTNP